MSKRLQTLVFLCTVFLISSLLRAQEFTGHITDSTSAVIRQAQITAHNQETGVDIQTISTNSGDYSIPYLKPGTYTVTASANGFSTSIKKDLLLEVGKTAVVNFELNVGKISESIIVEGDDSLDLGKADRGEVVENARVTELPLNGREPEMLAELNAGVIWGNSQNNSADTGPMDSVATSLTINGGGAGNNELLLDGVTNDSGNGNSVVGYVPPVDAVQEFKIVTNPYDAQYGRAQGGVVDMTLKSGTNHLHGDIYEFARRTWLDADTWQNDYLNAKTPHSVAKGQHKLDQYGAELDGPVVFPKLYNGRDKSFFLLQFENWKEHVPSTLVTSVPDPAWIGQDHDFSNLTWWTGSTNAPITIYDPATIHDDGTGKLVRNPFPGNKIPSGRINAVAQKLLSYYPKPNLTPASGTNHFANNYTIPNPSDNNYRNVLGKLDMNLSTEDRFTLRFGYWERWQQSSGNGMPGAAKQGAEPFGQHGPTFAADWVHTFTPTLVFDLRASFIARYNGWHDGPAEMGPSTLGWTGEGLGNHFPKLSISEFAQLGNGGANIDIENMSAILPSLTWIKGHHTVHAGIDARDLQKSIKEVEGGTGFSVDRLWTQANYLQWDQASGNSIASLLLGTPDSGSDAINPEPYWVQHYYAPYIQDDWKATRKLTINLGLRYDLNGPVMERHNRVDYAFDTTITNPADAMVDHSMIPGGKTIKGGVTFVGVNGKPSTFYATTKTNFQPRIGFAYALNDKTVLRGGVGKMFKNPTPGGNTNGWSSSTSFVASEDNNMHPTNTLTNPFPTGTVPPVGSSLGALQNLGNSTWFINPKYKTPGIWQFSIGGEHEFTRSDTVEISYVGSRGINQDTSDNINTYALSYVESCNVEMGGNHNICDNYWGSGDVPNPYQNNAAFAQSGWYYGSSRLPAGEFTRPYIGHQDVTEWQLNDGKTWYNSLQVTAMHKWKNDLTVHGTWTWSKLMGSGGYADETYRIKARWIDGGDIPNRVTLSGVYHLPVGRGRLVLGHTNHVVDAALGGWELGSLYIYQTGTPWGVPSGLEYQHNAHVNRSTDKGTGYIRGVAACVDNTDLDTGVHTPYQNNYTGSCAQPDFVVRPGYAATQNVTYTGIRVPNLQQFDSNLAKNFALYSQYKLQLRLEAFNVLNHPLWQEGYNGTASDPNFGTIERGAWGQSNLPRQVQIAAKIVW
jgi:hypothetical protein